MQAPAPRPADAIDPRGRAGVFHAAPVIEADEPGFDFVLALLSRDERFVFAKLNHGFWERLATLEELGVPRAEIATRPGREIDRLLGIAGSKFAEGGLLAELLDRIGRLPPPEEGMHFVASLSPFPEADRIEGTPLCNTARCKALIDHFVPEAHRQNVARVGFTGHEMKLAAMTGGLSRLIEALRGRSVIFLGNPSNRALIDAMGIADLTVIKVDAKEARLTRDRTERQLFKAVADRQAGARPPVVLAAAGGALSSLLALRLWDAQPRFQFVDLGGTLAAFAPETAMKVNWTSTYQRQLAAAVPRLGLALDAVTALYAPRYGLRDPMLVELAVAAGVPEPGSCDELPVPSPGRPIPFIENKPYDHQRLADLLSLSLAQNHHANGGPVAALLERMVAARLKLPESRRVVAIDNGTSAIHLAAGLHAYAARKADFRWVTSAFGFFSCNVGPLGSAMVIDCDARGRFDLEALKALPAESYDGVIYTNVFAQQSDWDDVRLFCAEAGKALVVDNATGLLDRPASALAPGAPMETISAHHTKPWGVGEGGFVLCDAEQERMIRQMMNFGVRNDPFANHFASNYKMSDLAAAAIIDRLERMPYWAPFYARQERRMRSVVIDTGQPIEPFPGTTQPLSPRAHAPFLCPRPVAALGVPGPVTLRKYYMPVRQSDGRGAPTPHAEDLFARCFSLSNAPEMRLVANEEIVAQLLTLGAW
ncbi:MAG: DegT/DnrJ/EryC1/StrS aminotransferase family protein [Defluviimonas sp.]|uniref:DegT/DnrJ/EryC1/StrS family aminotransferase n=1 Tax=Albidovulum sp. TaxID=1872424 RepID=UPI001E0FF9C6|nr:DegT/DnrJ/EryC1/StrS aminotransferase family protein [Paracoccaceae bacterium]MCC0063319.1 DegT/DnrJ/EryC1/StrS aminotransferase family protein [Defluviimonas sp.]